LPSRFFFSDSGDLVGAHVSTRGGLPTAFARATAIGASAVALFTKSSNQWKAKPLTDDDVAAFAAARDASSIRPLIAHASYLINLATTNPDFHEKSIAAMIDELQRAERLGVSAVVLHPGAHMGAGTESGIDQIACSLDRIHREIPGCRTFTLLETAAGQGSCVGRTFDELGAIRRLVDEKRRVGVCVDTCHVFSAGYEIRTRDGYERTIQSLDRAVGIEHVGAFHLNDSKKGLGSRVDRHQHIGEGEIGLEAFGFLLNDPRFTGIPKVIETPKPTELDHDIANLGRLRALIGEKQRSLRKVGRVRSGSLSRRK
jgi:deoxyribonuclease IV